jgi:hypothetical protein
LYSPIAGLAALRKISDGENVLIVSIIQRGKDMFQPQRVLMMIAGILVLCLTGFPAGAQDENQQQSSSTASSSSPQISDTQLEKVAKAYTEIRVIHDEFQQSVQTTEDQDKRLQLQQQANEKMVEVVESTGIDVQTYNQVIELVRVDEELSQRFFEKIQKIEKGG